MGIDVTYIGTKLLVVCMLANDVLRTSRGSTNISVCVPEVSGTDSLHEELLHGNYYTHLTSHTQKSHSGASHMLETQNLPAATHAPQQCMHLNPFTTQLGCPLRTSKP